MQRHEREPVRVGGAAAARDGRDEHAQRVALAEVAADRGRARGELLQAEEPRDAQRGVGALGRGGEEAHLEDDVLAVMKRKDPREI